MPPGSGVRNAAECLRLSCRRLKLINADHRAEQSYMKESPHDGVKRSHVMSEPLGEKRQHRRFPVQFRSSFSFVNIVEGEGVLADLSVRGCRIESRIAVKPGTELQLKIHLPHEPAPLGITVAAVRWSRGEIFGVEFTDMKDEEWKRLGRFIKQVEWPDAGATSCP